MRRARGGLLRMSVEAGVMPVERREQVTRIRISRVNGQPEELEGLDGRRQPSLGGTSRVSREAQARICEGLGCKSRAYSAWALAAGIPENIEAHLPKRS